MKRFRVRAEKVGDCWVWVVVQFAAHLPKPAWILDDPERAAERVMEIVAQASFLTWQGAMAYVSYRLRGIDHRPAVSRSLRVDWGVDRG